MPVDEVFVISSLAANDSVKTPRQQTPEGIMVIGDDVTSLNDEQKSRSAWKTLRRIGKEVKHDTAKAFRSMRRKMTRNRNSSVKEISLAQESYEDPRWASRSAGSTGSHVVSSSISSGESSKDDEIEVIYDAEVDTL